MHVFDMFDAAFNLVCSGVEMLADNEISYIVYSDQSQYHTVTGTNHLVP